VPLAFDGSEDSIDPSDLIATAPNLSWNRRTRSGAIAEAGQAIDAKLTPEDLQRVPFKLLVSHRVVPDRESCSGCGVHSRSINCPVRFFTSGWTKLLQTAVAAAGTVTSTFE